MGSQPLAVPQNSPYWQLMKSVCQKKLMTPNPDSLSSPATDHPHHTLLPPSLGQSLAVQSNLACRYRLGWVPSLGWAPGEELARPHYLSPYKLWMSPPSLIYTGGNGIQRGFPEGLPRLGAGLVLKMLGFEEYPTQLL